MGKSGLILSIFHFNKGFVIGALSLYLPLKNKENVTGNEFD